MGRPKGTLLVDGERLVDRAARVLRDGGCEPVFAVVRAGVDVVGARTVVNPDPDRGLRSSLDLAVSAADVTGADALAVLLADVPGVDAAAVRDVLGGWRSGRIAVATYGARRGHPIVMDVPTWRAALSGADADAGARALLRRRPQDVDEVPVSGDPTDLDTPDDLRRWLAR